MSGPQAILRDIGQVVPRPWASPRTQSLALKGSVRDPGPGCSHVPGILVLLMCRHDVAGERQELRGPPPSCRRRARGGRRGLGAEFAQAASFGTANFPQRGVASPQQHVVARVRVGLAGIAPAPRRPCWRGALCAKCENPGILGPGYALRPRAPGETSACLKTTCRN